MAAALTHVEKMLADAYRRELDQEENVWRSLPFFAATLALQLAALFQIVQRLPAPGSHLWPAARACLAVSMIAPVVALGFLAASIFPARFQYTAFELDLIEYAEQLDSDTSNMTDGGAGPPAGEVELKRRLARQHALALDHDRKINQRRARWRATAGLVTLFSILATMVPVVLVVGAYMQR